MSNKVAVIDLGTNSLITIIAEKQNNDIKIINENYQIIRLGEGLDDTGNISNNAVNRCISGFEIIRKLIDNYYVKDVICVATSAIREAQNGQLIIELIQKQFQIKIQVIDGIKEAKIVAKATQIEFNLKNKNILIFDIGGGSTELIFLKNGKIIESESLKIGSVRCTEAFLKQDPPNKSNVETFERYLKNKLIKIPNFEIEEAIGIAGTVTTLSSVNLYMETYNPEKIHKSIITKSEIKFIRNLFQTSNLSQRKKIKGLDAKRAEVILAGTIICHQIIIKFKLEKINVSDRGLRWGLLYEELG